MQISCFDVKKVASLAKLELSESEVTRMQEMFDEMTEFLKVMDEITITNEFEDEEQSNLRADIEEPSFEREALLKNSKNSVEGYFTVPRIVG